MGTTKIGLSVAPMRDKLYPATLNTASLTEGAAVVYDTGNGVKAPAGAAAKGFAGLITDVMPTGGSTSGMDVNLQRNGIGMGILAVGVSCVRGDRLIIANASGHLKVIASETAVDIIGEAETALTGGAAAQMVGVNLDAFASIP
jgi:hypothetical protein